VYNVNLFSLQCKFYINNTVETNIGFKREREREKGREVWCRFVYQSQQLSRRVMNNVWYVLFRERNVVFVYFIHRKQLLIEYHEQW